MKSFRSFMALSMILFAFIAGFHLLSSFSFRGKNSYLTTLDKDLFKVQSSDHQDNPFAISRIVKFTVPFNLLDSDLLNLNTFAFTNREVNNSVKTGIFDLSKNLLTYEFNQQNKVTNSKVSVSADGKMIIASYTGTNGVTNVYDAATNKKLYTLSGVFSATWLPDSIRFVGMDDYLFVQNTKTGQRENLLKIPEYVGKVPKSPLSLFVLKDGQTVCLYYHNGVDNLLSVDLNTGKQWNKTLKGKFFNLVPIDNTNIAAEGFVDGQYGIFLYNVTNDSLEPLIDLKQKKLIQIGVSPDGKKLAYSIIKSDTGGYGVEIHAVYLNNNNAINRDEVIYKESNQFIDKLIWTKDSKMLYCFQRDTDGTNIYRIMFKSS
jgi:hypothetical protein